MNKQSLRNLVLLGWAAVCGAFFGMFPEYMKIGPFIGCVFILYSLKTALDYWLGLPMFGAYTKVYPDLPEFGRKRKQILLLIVFYMLVAAIFIFFPPT